MPDPTMAPQPDPQGTTPPLETSTHQYDFAPDPGKQGQEGQAQPVGDTPPTPPAQPPNEPPVEPPADLNTNNTDTIPPTDPERRLLDLRTSTPRPEDLRNRRSNPERPPTAIEQYVEKIRAQVRVAEDLLFSANAKITAGKADQLTNDEKTILRLVEPNADQQE